MSHPGTPHFYSLPDSNFRLENGRIIAEVVISGRGPVSATIDTGATESFISERKAKELHILNLKQNQTAQIRLSDGLCLEVKQAVVAKVRFSSQEAELTLLVLPVVRGDVRLGLDFLCLTNARINCGRSYLQLMSSSYL